MQRLVLLAVCAVSPLAHGEAKFTHSATVKPQAKLTDRSHPKPQSGGTAAPTATQVLEIRELQGPIEEAKLAILDDLYRKTPPENIDERADYLFRMATIYTKKHRFHHMRAVEAELAKNTALHDQLAKQSRNALLAAVSKYQLLVDDPAFTRVATMDMVLFYFAYTLQGAGYTKEARTAYDKLLKNYPGSKYAAEAHLAFADSYFEQSQWADAEARYRQVLKFPSSRLFRYAQYKLAWVHYRQSQFTEAMQGFNDVAQATRGVADQESLYKAARKDFVRSYAEVGKADKALAMFRRVDTTNAYAMLEQLADIYTDQGKHDRAVYVLRELMTEQPTSPKTCLWQHSIARAMLAIGSGEDKIREIEQLAKLYSGVAAKLPKAEARECADAASEMTGQLARAFHQEAAKTKNRELAGFSKRLYRSYLAAFGKATDYAETLYYHAELSWLYAEWETDARLATQRWEDTAAAFHDVLERAATKLPANLVAASADAEMLAWMKALQVDPTVQRGQVEDDAKAYLVVPTPKPIPKRELALIAAFDSYLKWVKGGDDSERIDVLFHEARVLQRYDHWEPAIAIYEQIVTRHPKHATAGWSAQRALDGYNRLQRYADMLAFADRVPKQLLADDAELTKTIAKLRRQALRKEAEQLEKAGKASRDLAKYVACGDKYLAIYNLDPLADDAAEVLYNSGFCYEQGRSLSAAQVPYTTLQQYFPKTPLAAKSIARLGGVYASIAYYREAAEKYEQYAIEYGGEKDARDLLSDAAQFRKGVGDDAKAIEDTTKFIAMYGKKQPAAAADAFFSIAAIYEKQGDLDKLARHLRQYIDQYGASGGAERRLIALAKLGNAMWQSSCAVATVDHTCMRMTRVAAVGRASVRRATTRNALPKRCGEETVAEIVMVPRDAGKVRAAMNAFEAAIRDYEQLKPADLNDRTRDARGALYHYALARFGKVEHDYERYLALEIPSNLDFDPARPAIAKQSSTRFTAWYKRKIDQGVALRGHYDAIVGLKDGAVAIAAAARTGAVLQNFSAQLFRAEVPANVRNGPGGIDAVNAYCDELAERSEPLAIDAEKFYDACLTTSTRLGWFSEWSRICERELGQLRPKQYPQAFERWSAANGIGTIRDLERPVAIQSSL